MWAPQTPPLEIVMRVAILYLALFAMIRLAGKREVGQLTPIDLLGMLAFRASSVGVSRLAYRFPKAERWLDGEPTLLIENGRLIAAAARSERITVQEIEAALRRQGLERIEQVGRAVVETNGEITIVPREARDDEGAGRNPS